jgi:hypothetical protein
MVNGRQWTVGSGQWAVDSPEGGSPEEKGKVQRAKFKEQSSMCAGRYFPEWIKNEAAASFLCRLSTLYSILSTLFLSTSDY